MAKRKQLASSGSLRSGLIRISKVYLLMSLIYVAQIMAYDASKLITPEVVLKRWIAVTLFAVVATIAWYIAHTHAKGPASYRWLAWGLITAGIAFASYNVYTQRGMASRAVLLYIVPIVAAGVLASRAAVFAAALLSTAAYTLTAQAYFVNYFNEGYKIELYGEVAFYSLMFFVVAGLMSSVLKLSKDSA
jgi:hypothetical protein